MPSSSFFRTMLYITIKQREISTNEFAMLFDPMKLVYEVKSSSRTNVGVRYQEDTYFK
jgi:hypothetical protein